jgi:hypothetical protein
MSLRCRQTLLALSTSLAALVLAGGAPAHAQTTSGEPVVEVATADVAPSTSPIRVLATGGRAAMGTTTRLRFESDGPVPVHRVVDTDMGYGSSAFGGTLSYYGERTERLCTAPCEVEVPNGTYGLRAGDSLVFGGRFTVDAMGGEQAWEVERDSPWMGVGGIMTTALGAAGLTAGGMFMLLRDENTPDSLPRGEPLLLVSAPLTALGIWMLVSAMGEGEPLE